jgi:endonuclease YncB( thermonuclease family)
MTCFAASALVPIGLLLTTACSGPQAPLTSASPIEVAERVESKEPVDPTSWVITEIYWSDADSGRINGERFRLYNIDAPETGGVGAAIGPAQCELERERGFAAKEFMVELTRDADLKISATHGYDKMPEPRLLIELTANGEDVAAKGIKAGFLKPWPHDGTKALAPKPDWCQ